MTEQFKSGFVNIIGYPNVGKSTLMNSFLKEKVSIITHKAQTTRNRILGFLNDEKYQVIFSDTPGILDPKYELQRAMLAYIKEALDDADIILYLVEAKNTVEKHQEFIDKIKKLDIPVFLIINKIDEVKEEEAKLIASNWKNHFSEQNIFLISALHNFNIDLLLKSIIEALPVHPSYFDEDILTDKSERFNASEIIREKIFLLYKQEIPYSSEVIVTSFKEEEKIIRISADIIVERESQKPILIGKSGSALKQTGTLARKEMEEFFKKKIYLELYVKVRENWRNNKNFLKQFGYLR